MLIRFVDCSRIVVVFLLLTRYAFASSSCVVNYSVEQEWHDGFSGKVEITQSGAVLEEWQVQWSMPDSQQVYQLWNGEWQQDGDRVSVSPLSWNSQVADGGTIAFGFNSHHNGENTTPADISLNGLLCSGQAVIAPDPEPDPVPEPESEAIACSVEYILVNQWDNGFQAELKLQNSGSALTDWQLGWSLPDSQQINNLWNGQWQQDGTAVIVNPADWNQTLAADSELVVGFTANTSGNFAIPQTIALNGVLCDGPPALPEPVTACSVDYQIREQWNNGFTADVLITNTGEALSDWQVSWSMPLDQSISESWNGVFQQTGSEIQVAPLDWNRLVDVNQVINIGFNASHTGLNPKPVDLAVNGVRCEGQADTVQLPPNAPSDFNLQVESNVRVAITWVDQSDNEQTFVLQRKTLAGDWQLLATINADSEAYVDSSLLPGELYQYRIAAENAVGLSAFIESQSIGLNDRNAMNTADVVNTCAGCHGTDGVSQGPAIPSIAGLGRDYLNDLFKAYQDGSRYSSMMQRVAKGYTDAQIGQISDYFSKRAFVAMSQAMDMALVQQGLQIQRDNCEQCHINGGRQKGATGVVLNGQWQAYLLASMESYQLGLNANSPAPMLLQMEQLSSQQLLALSHYYASALSDESIEAAINQVPRAVDDIQQGLVNTISIIQVLTNDSDPEGDVLVVTELTTPANGVATIIDGESVQYTPATDFVGQDTFNYTVSDSQGLTATASIVLNIVEEALAIPEAVTDLIASVINQTDVRLSWTDTSSVETGFRIERRLTGQQSWQLLAELGSNSTTYTDTNVDAGQQYEYAVTAYNQQGDSEATQLSVSLPVLSDAGAALYLSHNCQACHGANGEGGISNTPLNQFTAADTAYLINSIDQTMPPSNPALCSGDCATAITAYIVEILNDGGSETNACLNAQPASPRSLRLLTRQEYQNTVHDLLGLSTPIIHELAEENRVGGFDNNLHDNQVTTVRLQAYLSLAETLAKTVLAENKAMVYSCDSSDPLCATSMLQGFGLRAFRRPLLQTELDHYLQVFTGQEFDTAIEEVVMQLLSSPHFLYRSELGELQQDGSYQLTAYEIASLLSYQFWGTMPDAVLLDAAQNNQLLTAAQRLAQANRLLNDERARTQAGQFAGQWLLSSSPYILPDKSNTIYPAYSAEIKAALSRELIEFFNYIVFDSSSLVNEFYQANYVLANSQLATYYGLNSVAGETFQPTVVTDDTRHGLLTLGAVLARYSNSDESHPFKRGEFLFERLLCHELPEPANMGVISTPVSDPDATTRERFSFHSESDPTCYSCHQYIDGPGFGFENYDAAGQFRAQENQQPIDASGLLRGLETFTPEEERPFSGMAELSQIMAQSPKAAQCVAEQYYRYTTGRLEDEYDRCAIDRLLEAHKDSGYHIKTMLMNVVGDADYIKRRAQ